MNERKRVDRRRRRRRVPRRVNREIPYDQNIEGEPLVNVEPPNAEVEEPEENDMVVEDKDEGKDREDIVVQEETESVVELRKRTSKRTKDPQYTSEEVVDALLSALEHGYSLALRKVGGNVYEISKVGDEASEKVGMKLKGNELFYSEEFIEWQTNWKRKTYEEKIEYAEKVGAEWEQHEMRRINSMRATKAVRLLEGIEKYKEGYRTRRERSEAKKKLERGLIRVEDL